VEGRPGVVTLERADGARVEWHPVNQPNMSAYSQGQRELAAGDLVRFTENNHQQGIVNGERATVVSHDAEAQRLTLEKSDGTRLTLDTDKPLHLDHGYCQTVHSAQGQTCERVMIEAEASRTAGNESLYYVAVSRAEHEVTIYTNDKEALPEAMSRTDTKSAALELPEQKAQTKESELSL
jgi:ATP-dependent exoDNAse (exonuclease V) alpha subunit